MARYSHSAATSAADLDDGSSSPAVRPSVMLVAKSTRLASIEGATVPCWLNAIAASAVMRARGVTWLTTNTIGFFTLAMSSTVPATARKLFGDGRTGTTTK